MINAHSTMFIHMKTSELKETIDEATKVPSLPTVLAMPKAKPLI